MSMDEAEIEAQALHDQRKREHAEIARLRADLKMAIISDTEYIREIDAEIARLRAQRDALLAICRAARIIIKNRDQRPDEAKLLAAIQSTLNEIDARAEEADDPSTEDT